ncbi:ATP-binding protein [Candidatus Phytoplasma meliae]|uniref:AAA family ATPase n=1 Tax=Candidatus Phytoplasma meliae TaxID=1848402 RepID=A0ABS5CYX2_9MOLU|nr:AAA family ATPase [Candidatus Phytoplasma meliae]MBP5836172.1 AAA family ATPase [Candidatus Phytoplasma meliae]MBP5836275.1 AAA family ATPase [Candidatus Phytoplasma meliae]
MEKNKKIILLLQKLSCIIICFIFLGNMIVNLVVHGTTHNQQDQLPDKVQNTNLGLLEYALESDIKKALQQKNPTLTNDDINNLQVNFILDTNKATLTSSQLSGAVEVIFEIKQKLNQKINNNIDLGTLNYKKEEDVKQALKKLKEANKISLNDQQIDKLKVDFIPYQNKANIASDEFSGQVQVTFSKDFLPNVIISEEIKKEFEHIIRYFKDFQIYKDVGATLPKGYILHGPPGTGKTYIVEQLEKELEGAYFIYRSGPEFTTSRVGASETLVRDMFKTAQHQNKPCVIFIDEIDAILSKRGATEGDSGGAVRSHNSTVNQFLTELDGFKKHPYPIIVIGATNKVELLDEAVVRPGRLEKKILISLPNKEDTKKILALYLKKINLASDLKEHGQLKDEFLNSLAEQCYELKMSPASIKYFVNEAALMAVEQEGEATISQNNLQKALDKYQDEQLKKIIKPQNLETKTFSITESILLWSAILTFVILLILCSYLFFKKYQKKQQLKIWGGN